MKICHFSDWHGTWQQLPAADLYICTGDMYPDDPGGSWSMINSVKSSRHQREWSASHPLRESLGNPDAQVICVRGNHDFTDLTPLFGGPCHELGMNAGGIFVYEDIRISGFRGIPYIGCGWSDELRHPDLVSLVEGIPDDIDVLVTHGPPAGILDNTYGCKAMAAYYNKFQYSGKNPPKYHLFGHIHEEGGQAETHGTTTFMNSAATYQVIDL